MTKQPRPLTRLILALLLASPLYAFDLEIPKGKNSDDYVKEAGAHVKAISPEDTKKAIDKGTPLVLLDIRSFAEFSDHGWIEGRTVVPHGMVMFKIRDIVPNRDIPIIVYCKKGKRSIIVAYQLQQMGYKDIKYLKGGALGWKNKGYPVKTSGTSKIAEAPVVSKGEMPTGITAEDLVAEANKLVKAIPPAEANRVLTTNSNAVLLDIRTQQEIGSQGAIERAIVMEHGKVPFNIKKKVHDANTRLFVICKKGGRSALIAKQLQEMGYKDVHHIAGGILAWKEAGLIAK